MPGVRAKCCRCGEKDARKDKHCPQCFKDVFGISIKEATKKPQPDVPQESAPKPEPQGKRNRRKGQSEESEQVALLTLKKLQEDVRLKTARAEQVEISNAVRSKDLVDGKAAIAVMSSICGSVTTQLEILVDTLPNRLVGLQPDAMRSVIDDQVRKLRKAVAESLAEFCTIEEGVDDQREDLEE